MTEPSRLTLVIASAFGAILSMQNASAAGPGFECLNNTKMLPATDAAELKSQLPDSSAIEYADRLNAIVDHLRSKGISDTMVIDGIITAYCPRVAATPDLSDLDKTRRIRAFAQRVTQIVYTRDTTDAIIVGVPLRPSIVDQIDQMASASSMSRDAWITQAIEEGLGKH